jgi:hypothetical protein
MILDDMSNFYNLESGHSNNVPFYQTNTIPSSFRPNYCLKDVNSNTINTRSSTTSMKQKSLVQRKDSKSCSNIMMYNEYDAIEANPINSESTGNLSASTTYSEVLNEDLSTKNCSSSNDSDVNFEYLNNNELISSTSILTQELESKLKERRQMIENKSDKYQPKLIQLNEVFSSISYIIFSI